MIPKYDVWFEHYSEYAMAVIKFMGKVEVMSSCFLNGGSRETDTVLIIQVGSNLIGIDPRTFAEERIRELSLPNDAVVFMTAAEVEQVLSEVKNSFNGFECSAIVTAGLSNQVIAGDVLEEWEKRHEISMERHRKLIGHPGTINTIGIVADPLSEAAKINILIAMTEAKSAAMHDLGYKETGTTSDAAAVIMPKKGHIQEFAGTGYGYGLSLAQAVRSAVRQSLIKRGDFPVGMPAEKIQELKERYL